MKKTGFRDVHGILLLDKPLGASSNQALQRARHLFRAQKAGHTGSLDPLATGLLPICFGEATKIAGHLLGARKAYAAQCRLGATTTTDDAEGEVVRTRAVPELDDAMIEAALAGLRGRIVQIPPAYSAIKQGGVPLYKRARRGEEVEVPAREVEVHALDLVARDADLLTLHVECGSGTYVRSLARDLGEALGCGAHLTALRRVWVEPFRQPAMWTLEQLQRIHVERGSAGFDELLLPLEQGLAMLPALSLSAEQAIGLRQGKRIAQGIAKDMPLCRALDAANRLVALVEIDGQGQVRVLRGFSAT
ncbi:tRNA pseudouridine(55) synthase TruB [Rudaea sp.]|uniref:tRNA pseudouridine(55) synthase TruB n=1 Tax=Rudaea sp. TaxID=2136325 RepID=UPI00321FD73A